MDRQETIADIIAEISGYRDPVVRERRLDVRLKAAIARERGDCAKLREAVGYILKYADSVACRDHDEHTRNYIDQIRKWAQSALAAPQRNCDVGTVEEQSKRKMKFCYQQGGCSNCSFSKSATLTQCALAWAQMPYAAQEGGKG